MSFTDWSVSSRGKVNFVGLSNYQLILSGKGTTSLRFLKSIKNLAIYVPMTSSLFRYMNDLKRMVEVENVGTFIVLRQKTGL